MASSQGKGVVSPSQTATDSPPSNDHNSIQVPAKTTEETLAVRKQQSQTNDWINRLKENLDKMKENTLSQDEVHEMLKYKRIKDAEKPPKLPRNSTPIGDDDQEVSQWLDDDDRTKLKYFLGKDPETQAAAEALFKRALTKGQLGAAFFFTKNRDAKNNIITTIAFQLAKKHDVYKDHILKAITKDPFIINSDHGTQFYKLIAELPSSGANHKPGEGPLAIIIEGLGRCSNPEQLQICNIIGEYARFTPSPPLTWFIFASKGSHLEYAIEGYPERCKELSFSDIKCVILLPMHKPGLSHKNDQDQRRKNFREHLRARTFATIDLEHPPPLIHPSYCHEEARWEGCADVDWASTKLLLLTGAAGIGKTTHAQTLIRDMIQPRVDDKPHEKPCHSPDKPSATCLKDMINDSPDVHCATIYFQHSPENPSSVLCPTIAHQWVDNDAYLSSATRDDFNFDKVTSILAEQFSAYIGKPFSAGALTRSQRRYLVFIDGLERLYEWDTQAQVMELVVGHIRDHPTSSLRWLITCNSDVPLAPHDDPQKPVTQEEIRCFLSDNFRKIFGSDDTGDDLNVIVKQVGDRHSWAKEIIAFIQRSPQKSQEAAKEEVMRRLRHVVSYLQECPDFSPLDLAFRYYTQSSSNEDIQRRDFPEKPSTRDDVASFIESSFKEIFGDHYEKELECIKNKFGDNLTCASAIVAFLRGSDLRDVDLSEVEEDEKEQKRRDTLKPFAKLEEEIGKLKKQLVDLETQKKQLEDLESRKKQKGTKNQIKQSKELGKVKEEAKEALFKMDRQREEHERRKKRLNVIVRYLDSEYQSQSSKTGLALVYDLYDHLLKRVIEDPFYEKAKWIIGFYLLPYGFGSWARSETPLFFLAKILGVTLNDINTLLSPFHWLLTIPVGMEAFHHPLRFLHPSVIGYLLDGGKFRIDIQDVELYLWSRHIQSLGQSGKLKWDDPTLELLKSELGRDDKSKKLKTDLADFMKELESDFKTHFLESTRRVFLGTSSPVAQKSVYRDFGNLKSEQKRIVTNAFKGFDFGDLAAEHMHPSTVVSLAGFLEELSNQESVLRRTFEDAGLLSERQFRFDYLNAREEKMSFSIDKNESHKITYYKTIMTSGESKETAAVPQPALERYISSAPAKEKEVLTVRGHQHQVQNWMDGLRGKFDDIRKTAKEIPLSQDKALKMLESKRAVGVEQPPKPPSNSPAISDVARLLDQSLDDNKTLKYLLAPPDTTAWAAHALFKRFEGRLGGAFFFPETKGDRDIGRTIITTIACQLANKSTIYKEHISNAIVDDLFILDVDRRTQFRKFIDEPSIFDFEGRPEERLVIIIDGLDRCGTIPEQLQIFDIISEYVEFTSSPSLLWFIFARNDSSHLQRAIERSRCCKKLEFPEIETKSRKDQVCSWISDLVGYSSASGASNQDKKLVDVTTKLSNLLSSLKKDEAQPIIDFLYNFLLQSPKWNLQDDKQTRTLDLLMKIVCVGNTFPRCLLLSGVSFDSNGLDRFGPSSTGPKPRFLKGKYKNGDVGVTTTSLRLWRYETPNVERVKNFILSAHIDHENILPFYGIYETGNKGFVGVVAWMKNGDLRKYLQENSKTPRLPFISDIISGLEYLHGMGIFYANLELESVLVSDDGRALLTLLTNIDDFESMGRVEDSSASSVRSKMGSNNIIKIVTDPVPTLVPFWRRIQSTRNPIPDRIVVYDGGSNDASLVVEIRKLLERCSDPDPGRRPSTAEIKTIISQMRYTDNRGPPQNTRLVDSKLDNKDQRTDDSERINYDYIYDVFLQVA
ncbi:hypothetical protein AN958_03008 [Leucoagaricus sp. SymC.cos]|nr:hypothetical protein AN958_03008 [Leucoagaricus sp. SymC.cos]